MKKIWTRRERIEKEKSGRFLKQSLHFELEE
jgi:hypothetical protein